MVFVILGVTIDVLNNLPQSSVHESRKKFHHKTQNTKHKSHIKGELKTLKSHRYLSLNSWSFQNYLGYSTK